MWCLAFSITSIYYFYNLKNWCKKWRGTIRNRFVTSKLSTIILAPVCWSQRFGNATFTVKYGEKLSSQGSGDLNSSSSSTPNELWDLKQVTSRHQHLCKFPHVKDVLIYKLKVRFQKFLLAPVFIRLWFQAGFKSISYLGTWATELLTEVPSGPMWLFSTIPRISHRVFLRPVGGWGS